MVMQEQGTRDGPPDLLAVAHDLRNPLTVILLEAERLLESALSREQQQNLERLAAGAALLDELLRSAVEGARPDVPDRWKWQKFDLPALCRGAVEAVRPIAAAFGVLVESAISADVGAVHGDAGALHRLLMDFLVSACQRTGATRVTLSVRPIAGRPRRIEVLVRDDAPGPVEHPVRARSRLWLCRTIATAHGGWVEARTSREQGSAIAAVVRTDLPGPRPAGNPEEITVVDVDVIAEPPLVA